MLMQWLIYIARYLRSRGKMWKIGIFSVKCCLLAFNIVPLGPVVSLELFVRRAYVASYYAYHIYPHPVFSSEMPLLYFQKATRFCREVLMFLPSIWLSFCFSSSKNKFIAPFVPHGTT